MQQSWGEWWRGARRVRRRGGERTWRGVAALACCGWARSCGWDRSCKPCRGPACPTGPLASMHRASGLWAASAPCTPTSCAPIKPHTSTSVTDTLVSACMFMSCQWSALDGDETFQGMQGGSAVPTAAAGGGAACAALHSCSHHFCPMALARSADLGNPYNNGLLNNCWEAFCAPIPPRWGQLGLQQRAEASAATAAQQEQQAAAAAAGGGVQLAQVCTCWKGRGAEVGMEIVRLCGLVGCRGASRAGMPLVCCPTHSVGSSR